MWIHLQSFRIVRLVWKIGIWPLHPPKRVSCRVVVCVKTCPFCVGVQVKKLIFGVQVKFRQNFSIMAAHPTTTLPPQHPAVFNHADRQHHKELSQPPIQSWTAKAATTRLLAACRELIIFPPVNRQHDLHANNHVDQPPPLAGRLLSYRRLLCRLVSPFVTQASPLPFLWWWSKVSFMTDVVLCRRKEQSSWDEQHLLSHRRGSLRFINWPNSDKVFKTFWSHGLGFRVSGLRTVPAFWVTWWCSAFETCGRCAVCCGQKYVFVCGVHPSVAWEQSTLLSRMCPRPYEPCQWLVIRSSSNVPRPITIYTSQFEISLADLLSGAIDSCWHVWILHFVSSF